MNQKFTPLMATSHLTALILLASATILLSAQTAAAMSATGIDNNLIAAIHQVETSGRLGPIKGDGGAALGPLQIHKAYHADSGIPGPYSRCADYDYSVRVFKAYMARYATVRRLGRKATAQDIARIHNGGPRAVWATGQKKRNLDLYWAKVKKNLK
jgi:hypothetical protein